MDNKNNSKINTINKSPLLVLMRLIYQNSKLFIWFNGTILILTIIILLLLPNWYRSESLVYIQSNNDNELSISSMMEGLPFNISGDKSYEILTLNKILMTSHLLLDSIIVEFDLHNIYNSKYQEDTYKIIKQNLYFNDNEDGTFKIVGYFEEDPIKAARLVNFTVKLLQDLNIQINRKSISDYRIFIEKIYENTKQNLFSLEEKLKDYQLEKNIVKLDDQISVLVEQISSMEAEKIKYEVEKEYLELNINKGNEQIDVLNNKISILESKITTIKQSNNYSNIALNDIPNYALQYYRIYREVMINQKLVEFLLPQVEKARIDEVKNITSLIVIDPAVPSEKKDKPKRTIILIIVCFISFIISILFAYIKNFYSHAKNDIINSIKN